MRMAPAIALLLAGCATPPQTWLRADGKVSSADQLALDRTVCQGEMNKANLSSTRKPLIEEIISPREQGLSQVYAGCMAQHGYIQR
jgi:hypothetical protein